MPSRGPIAHSVGTIGCGQALLNTFPFAGLGSSIGLTLTGLKTDELQQN